VIPLRDANPTKRFPVVTLALIAANVAVFLLWQPSFGTQLEQQTFYFCHAEIPWEVSHQENLARGGLDARAALDADLGPGAGVDVQTLVQVECPDKSWWLAIFVAMFLHGGWFHLAGNMLFLWIFGNNVEDRLGYVVYPLFYVLGGLAASGLQLAFAPDSTIPSLGASGAIGGILGAYIVLFPHARVLTLIIFFFITVVEIPAGVVLAIWFVLQLFAAWASSGRRWGAGSRTGPTSVVSRSVRSWPGCSTGVAVGSGPRSTASGRGPTGHDVVSYIIWRMDARSIVLEARLGAGLSQREVARRSGVPQASISRIERGLVSPRTETLDRLLRACGKDVGLIVRPGTGLDRTLIRDKLSLTTAERARLAVREWENTRAFDRAARG
jgi:membrane associated rhomboid family serine protease/transcriptional regulator with XRE-family HTH domain